MGLITGRWDGNWDLKIYKILLVDLQGDCHDHTRAQKESFDFTTGGVIHILIVQRP